MGLDKRTGVVQRHKASCQNRTNGRCGCPWRAEVWDNDAQRRIYRTFPTVSAAQNWRRDMQVKVKNGEVRASEPTTVAEAFEIWLDKAQSGVVRARGGKVYKPGVLRTYELSFQGRILKKLGHVKVGDLHRERIQRYVDELVAEGLAAQTVRNTINALRVLLRWCVRDGIIKTNPCDNLELPAGGKTRDRIAHPSEALDLIGALSNQQDQAIMATAFFAGLRRGELMALRWDCVDLPSRTIHVHPERGSYDPRTQTFGPPKSKKGARLIGIPDLLVPYLERLQHSATVLSADGVTVPHDELVFGRSQDPTVPFNETSLRERAVPAWEAAGLQPIGLHEARHTYASLMIAAGVNIKTISEWMGHSSVTITLDRYGHLLPGSTQVALGLLNDYLTGALEQ